MKMEKRILEQRCAIKFCAKLYENATETSKKLKRAYGEHALSSTQVNIRERIFGQKRYFSGSAATIPA
jgi:hypothetical protein